MQMKRFNKFEVGELVMAHLSKERTPTASYSKLQDLKIGPFRISSKIDPNAYVLELPCHLQISSTFNVKDLCEYFPPDAGQLIC